MAKKFITFKKLDQIIDSYKENRPQKRALLVLKSGCDPYRHAEEGIPIHIATRLMTTRISTEDLLAKTWADDDNDIMFDSAMLSSKHLNNVIHICFDEDD